MTWNLIRWVLLLLFAVLKQSKKEAIHTHTHTHWQNEYKRRKEGNQLSFHEWNEPDRWVLLVMLHPTTVVLTFTLWAFSCLLPDLSTTSSSIYHDIVKSHRGFLFSHDGRSSFFAHFYTLYFYMGYKQIVSLVFWLPLDLKRYYFLMNTAYYIVFE